MSRPCLRPQNADLAFFVGKARCVACHSGWSFTNHSFHDIGLDTEDLGRASIEPGKIKNQYAFKTPTLRNIQLHAPYMHHGKLHTLEAVVEHYDRGGVQRPSLSGLMRPVGLSGSEKRDIIALSCATV